MFTRQNQYTDHNYYIIIMIPVFNCAKQTLITSTVVFACIIQDAINLKCTRSISTAMNCNSTLFIAKSLVHSRLSREFFHTNIMAHIVPLEVHTTNSTFCVRMFAIKHSGRKQKASSRSIFP